MCDSQDQSDNPAYCHNSVPVLLIEQFEHYQFELSQKTLGSIKALKEENNSVYCENARIKTSDQLFTKIANGQLSLWSLRDMQWKETTLRFLIVKANRLYG